MKPRLLDLFCGAGGAAMGFYRAGFDVVGVDHVPQPNYPFEFFQHDAPSLLRLMLAGAAGFEEWPFYSLGDFVGIHASPPCKLFTNARRVHVVVRPTLFEPHADLVAPTRDLLRETGLPYVIENVPGAPLQAPVVLCGSMFGLRVRRHRLFETNWPLRVPECRHDEQPEVVGVYGNGGGWTRTAPGGGGKKVAGAEAAEALGIDWTTSQSELSQAIPPAYTELIGHQLMQHVRARSAA